MKLKLRYAKAELGRRRRVYEDIDRATPLWEAQKRINEILKDTDRVYLETKHGKPLLKFTRT